MQPLSEKWLATFSRWKDAPGYGASLGCLG